MNRRITAAALTTAFAASVVATGPAAYAGGPDKKEAPGQSELAEVRAATAKYHDVEAALADGYIDTEICVPEMGVHYVNVDLLDDELDATSPEILVYAPRNNGSLKLVAVEYGSLEGEDPEGGVFAEHIELFGQEFDRPINGFGPWYPTLHAWVWQANPDGMFAKHNPNVSCD